MLFNSTGEKRAVELSSGLNIITGESKSGKSALLEIIDYCLGSSRCTVPKGIITSFAELYSIILCINGDTNVVIGRPAFDQQGNTKMYVNLEPNGVGVNDINKHYFADKTLLGIKQAIGELERLLGLNVTDMSDRADLPYKVGKPSLRDMVSYLFQHQNLVASKFALFYRFDDSNKRERVIREFPVFSGVVDQEYYTARCQIDALEKELQKIKRNSKLVDAKSEETRQILFNTYANYYALIGEELSSEISFDELISLRNQLPEFKIPENLSDNLEQRYLNLQREMEQLRHDRHLIDMQIANLQASEQYGKDYEGELERLKQTNNEYESKHSLSYHCPLCGYEQSSLSDEAQAVHESLDWLENQLSRVSYSRNSFNEAIEKLRSQSRIIERDFRGVKKAMDEIRLMFNQQIEQQKSLQEQVMYAKIRLEIDTDLAIGMYKTPLTDDNLAALNAEIDYWKAKISNYNIESFYRRARVDIENDMNRIVEKLDFEDEFRPSNLNFELETTFDLYQQANNTRIYLGEMGSGANWLSCHIALSLSLLRFFCQKPKSSIPSILVFDQPSQVYFPDLAEGNEQVPKQSDVEAVAKVYATILDEIADITVKCGYAPQVIVTDCQWPV